MYRSKNSEKERVAANQAVCFAESDYAGLFRRLIIAGIDLATLVFLCCAVLIGTWLAWFALHPESEDPPAATLWLLPITAFVYLTVVKRSRLGSLGYLLTGVRIVDVEGKRPSLLQMTARIFWFLPLPLALLLDLAWLSEETARQTLRDKWAGTFVVRRNAKPIGSAPLRSKRIFLVGIQLIVPELDREAIVPNEPENVPPFDAGTGCHS